MNNWYTKIRRQNDDFISKNISLQSKRTLQLEKKNTQFNLESRNNTNKIYPNVLKKKKSILPYFDISEITLKEHSNYISDYLRKNLNITTGDRKKKSDDIQNHLKNLLLLEQKKKTVIVKKTSNRNFNSILNNSKKKNFFSTIVKKDNGNTIINISNSKKNFLKKSDSSHQEKIENNYIKNLYEELINKNYLIDISQDIIYKNGGFRKLFKQQQLNDSEESDDIVIDIDSSEKYIIKVTDNYLVLYKCFIFILIFFYIIFYPFVFAFNYHIPEYLIIIIDIIFIFDFCIGFFIGYYNEEGKIVKNLYLCFKNYLKTNFFKNLILSFPFLIVFHNSNSLYKILPLIRIFKFYEFIYNEKDSEIFYDELIINVHLIKSLNVHYPIYSFLTFFIGFFILCHLSSCIFIFLANFCYPNWETKVITDSSNYTKYLTAFYYSLTTIISVGYGDITPVSKYEKTYGIILMILGVCLYSIVLSILSSVFENVLIRERNFKKNIYLLDDLSDKYRIPNILYHKVLRYLKYTSIINSKDNNLLMNSLPKHYKSILLYEIHGENLNNLNFFKGQSNEFKFIAVLFLKDLNLIRGEYLIQTGDIVDEFYMVKKGILQIQKETNFEKRLKILKIREKEHFGEIYMISNLPMPFDVVGYSRYCELFYFKKSDFIILYEDFPKEIEKILHLSWKNCIRIEMKAKLFFEKAENQADIENLTLYDTFNENRIMRNGQNENNLSIISEEFPTIISFDKTDKNDIKKNNNNNNKSINNNNNININNNKKDSNRIKNYSSNSLINLVRIEKEYNNNLNKTFSKEYKDLSNYSNINQTNLLENKQISNINNSNISKNSNLNVKENNKKNSGTFISSSSKRLLEKNINAVKRQTSSNKLQSFDYHRFKREKSSPLGIRRRYSNNVNNMQLFHLPIINFTNENEMFFKQKRKSLNDSRHQIYIDKTLIRQNNTQKQINNYNVNFNLNIHNNYSSSNNKLNDFPKTQKSNKGTIGNILKNLKGLSENLKNPSNLLKIKKKIGKTSNYYINSIINNENSENIDILKMQIEKIDSLFEKILMSIIEKKIKK